MMAWNRTCDTTHQTTGIVSKSFLPHLKSASIGIFVYVLCSAVVLEIVVPRPKMLNTRILCTHPPSIGRVAVCQCISGKTNKNERRVNKEHSSILCGFYAHRSWCWYAGFAQFLKSRTSNKRNEKSDLYGGECGSLSGGKVGGMTQGVSFRVLSRERNKERFGRYEENHRLYCYLCNTKHTTKSSFGT